MTPLPSLHWIGAGLASGPGIVALADKTGRITVWDMTPERAEALQKHSDKGGQITIRHLDLDQADSLANFRSALHPGDIVISMLPAALHGQMARLALSEGCHMVTSSYLTDDMTSLNDEAVAKGLSIVNEVGLDPGIDHLFAHMLVDAARQARVLNQNRTVDFISCCGGFPAIKTPFTYKFSWTPAGVLNALTNPARMIRDGREQTVAKAWQGVTEMPLGSEIFESYPNRNSLPYIAEYGLGGEKGLRNFMRGTLRLSGWKEAWKDIFTILDRGPDAAELKALSDRLMREYSYARDEQDRVVLYVALSATARDGKLWKAALTLDTTGSGWQSAMARTVSLTVAQAVEAVLGRRLPAGVITAPRDIAEVRIWLRGLQRAGLEIQAQNIDLTL